MALPEHGEEQAGSVAVAEQQLPLRTDLTTLAAYVSDASIYRRKPHAVLEPRNVDEIRQGIALARQNNWPITGRGGGTSVAGNAIGEGLIIDTSRYFNQILEVDAERRVARVQPGVICDQLRDAAAEFGLTYGPDPSTHARCTIGGMVGNNACGSHSVAWGTAADNLVSMWVMLDDGREIELTPDGCSDPTIDAKLRDLRDNNLAMLRTELGRFPRQVSGYGLHYLLPEKGFDVARAFVGSEGTCGIITELTVTLVEKPRATALAVLAFPTVFDAAAASAGLRLPGVYTIEGMGSDLLGALRSKPGQQDAGRELPASETAGGWLFCETGADTREEAEGIAAALVAGLDGNLAASDIVLGAAEARALWRIREASAGIVTRLPDGGEAWPGWEDSAVPPEHLAEYLRDLYALMDESGLRGIPFGHFGEGCVHLRLSFDLYSDEGVAAYRRFMERAADIVAGYGGSLSGEHGDGRARSELLHKVFSKQAMRAFREFKTIFDPSGRFNPGVLVDPDAIDDRIRPGKAQRANELIPVHALSRDNGSFVAAVNRCVGVGACRSDVGSMCPSFQATGDEVHSTRGRARVLSEMLRGETIADGWRSTEVKDALDLCLSCKACSSECPVNVDMATYKSEFLNRFYHRRLRPMAHYTMGWLPLLMRYMHKVPGVIRLANAVLSVRWIEEVVKRLGGIEPKRRMIAFAPQTMTSWFRKRGAVSADTDGALKSVGSALLTGRGTVEPQRTVMLWPDTFSNFNSPAVGIAAVEVLEALGYNVIIPKKDVCCGLTWHSTGQLEQTKRVLTATLDALEPAIAANIPIVGLEPSCTVMLADECPELLPNDQRAKHLAKLMVTLAEIVDNHDGPWPFGQLDVPAVTQVHCHQEAKGSYDADASVLEKVGVCNDVVGAGCCGLAGNFGFEPGHFEISQTLAERELFPKIRGRADDTLVLADGFSCRTQVSQGTGVEAQHLAQVLRSALDAPTRPDAEASAKPAADGDGCCGGICGG
ncbi:FAD-binding and (Fe-S)-binding domain-containing protein [Lysinibacter cavernae]|uniref:FAD/FMN-containing dehydrogenase/Fe-S oxidoreductase n=1 Tax=Lysinibacter cavernae TaxID=1640652 RepID=A0A7X5TTU4_9MICO|nr:FAD-binding and (Fe-S)-binding domain-containing protein [Lysinibacter cavernae]NIH53889.1 FAD/FMN-containing dehydrogenase/Fe-S oxidoreductase [Lysinibacter cavernae]